MLGNHAQTRPCQTPYPAAPEELRLCQQKERSVVNSVQVVDGRCRSGVATGLVLPGPGSGTQFVGCQMAGRGSTRA